MRRLLLITISIGCLVLLSGPDAHAQKDLRYDQGPQVPSMAWQVSYSGELDQWRPGTDRAVSMALHPDGAIVYVIGESEGMNNTLDYTTLAYDTANGTQLWESRYDPPWRMNDEPTHIEVSPDGNIVFVTGKSIGSGDPSFAGEPPPGPADWDFVTVAYDAGSGVQLWEQRYHGHQRGAGWTNSMAVAPDGTTVLINGRSNCADNPQTPESEPGNATIAYDALTGAQMWVACYDTCLSHGDFGAQLAVSGDSRVAIVAGTRLNHGTGYDFAVVAYDMRWGRQLWTRYYDNGLHNLDPDAFPVEPIVPGADPTLDSPRAIAVDPRGNAVYVSGVSRGRYGLVDYVTLAYEVETGRQTGIARFDGALNGNDRANAIAVSRDGRRVFVTGESATTDVGREVVTIAYDASLSGELWVRRHNTSETPGGIPDGRDDIARMIALSGDGRSLLVGGDSWGANSLDWMVVAYDAATGTRQWSGIYDGDLCHADFYRGMALNGNATRVFLTGHSCSCGTSGMDILTMGIQVLDTQSMISPSPWSSPRRGGRHIRDSGRQR